MKLPKTKDQAIQPAGANGSARRQFQDQFIADVYVVWEGMDAWRLSAARWRSLINLCRSAPAWFRKTYQCASRRSPAGLDADDWQLLREILEAVREGLPDVQARKPGAVFAHVLAALQAYRGLIAAPPPGERPVSSG